MSKSFAFGHIVVTLLWSRFLEISAVKKQFLEYTDSRKKQEVAPKRGLIALAVNIQSNMANEEEKSISLLMIFPASV